METQFNPLGLPHVSELEAILGLRRSENVSGWLNDRLVDPLRTFFQVPGKKFRHRLVEQAYQMVHDGPPTEQDLKLCAQMGDAIECVHAGSLLVDDIEDASSERRGQPTFHRQHGVPTAINSGSWLYFWAMQLCDGLAPEKQLSIYKAIQKALLKAHFGQALDIGVPAHLIERDEVRRLYLASVELKTGALAGLATLVGALLGGADKEQQERWLRFGTDFGVALQMLDDVGNTNSESAGSKRFEDLKLRRPSWVWVVAAEHGSDEEYGQFLEAVQCLPETGNILTWVNDTKLLGLATKLAKEELRRSFRTLSEGDSSMDWTELNRMVAKLEEAYL